MNKTILEEAKKEFDGKFKGELYSEIYNQDWIAKREEKYIWVSQDEKVWSFISSLVTRVEKESRKKTTKELITTAEIIGTPDGYVNISNLKKVLKSKGMSLKEYIGK